MKRNRLKEQAYYTDDLYGEEIDGGVWELRSVHGGNEPLHFATLGNLFVALRDKPELFQLGADYFQRFFA